MSDSNTNTASTVLGTIGTVCWCIQLIPQIYRNYRHKDCEGMPPAMMFLWAASGVPFGVYFIVLEATMAIRVQPHLFMFFATCVWAQCLYYPPVKWPVKRLVLVVGTVCLLFAGIEIGLVFPLRIVYRNGVTWPTTLVGVIAAVLLAVGLIPPYFEIYKHHGEVVGFNFVFLGLDFSGALFSIFAVIAQHGDLDILGITLYCIVAGLEAGIFICQLVWLYRTRHERALAKLQKKKEKELAANTDDEAATGNTTTEELTTKQPEDIEKTSPVADRDIDADKA